MGVSSVRSSSESDIDLAARFTRDVVPYFDVLSRIARRLTRNNADAEDLVQDALLHAYAGFRTFQEGTNLKSWLFRILYNRWISTHRAITSRPTELSAGVVTDQDLALHPSRQPAGSRSAEVLALDMLFDNEIRAAMGTLPEGCREVLYCTLVQGYTSARTAALLGLPMGTVMSRLSRGRQRLRIALAAHHGRSTHSRAEFSTMMSQAVS